jgi:hypothetical protein
MGWDKHMADIRMSETKRILIFELTAPPLPHEMAYIALTKVVDDYIRRGMQIGWGHNNHSRVRKHLAQGAHILPNAYVFRRRLEPYCSDYSLFKASMIIGTH